MGRKEVPMSGKEYEKVTVAALRERKHSGQKIVCLTAYDYPTARILDETGEIDIVLVGDSLGMAVLGYETTVPVTMDEMIHHTRCVSRGVRRALVVGDMPYLSFHMGEDDCIRNAARFVKEGGASAVKLEGASQKRIRLAESLVEAEIPVMGHVGLTPQSINRLGSYQVQGMLPDQAGKLMAGAKNLESAGVFAIVLESVPLEVAEMVTASLSIPTIGIGAGPHCDGQVLVFHDVMGISLGHVPRFVRKYADLKKAMSTAAVRFAGDVRAGKFPDDETSYHLKPETRTAVKKRLQILAGGRKK